MKKIHKIFVFSFVLFAFTPSLVLASWWNPISWFDFLFHPKNNIETAQQSTSTVPTTATSAVTVQFSNGTKVKFEGTPIQTDINEVATKIPTLPASFVPDSNQSSVVNSAVPIIGSFNNGVITGQHFTGTTAVYLYSIPLTGGTSQRVNFNFVPVSDTIINTSGSYNVDDASKPSPYFKLYVANAVGVSVPVEVYFPSVDSSQTLANQQEDCWNKGITEETQMIKQLNDAHNTPGISSIQGQMEVANQGITNLNSYIKSLVVTCGGSSPAQTPAQSVSSNKTDIYGVIYAALNGTTVYGSNGTTYSRSGSDIYGPNGTTYTFTGNTIYEPNGSTYSLSGNTFYGPKGVTYTQSGNTIYGSDGSSATNAGGTIYVKSGY